MSGFYNQLILLITHWLIALTSHPHSLAGLSLELFSAADRDSGRAAMVEVLSKPIETQPQSAE
jgi:hypothetical protein